MSTATPHSMHNSADALNEALGEAENALLALNLGVTASVPLQGLPGAGPCKRLVFGKRDGGWGLFVEDADGVVRTPVKSSSREIRCAVAHHLAVLHAAILNAAIENHETTVLATTVAREFVATLSAPGRSGLPSQPGNAGGRP